MNDAPADSLIEHGAYVLAPLAEGAAQHSVPFACIGRVVQRVEVGADRLPLFLQRPVIDTVCCLARGGVEAARAGIRLAPLDFLEVPADPHSLPHLHHCPPSPVLPVGDLLVMP